MSNRWADEFAKAHKIPQSFIEATDHPYQCTCPKCLDWWVDMGPEDYDNFGPFSWRQVSDRATERGVPFTRGVKPS